MKISMGCIVILGCLLISLATAQPPPPESLPGCSARCGNIDIPYPFGFEPRCSRDGFDITCNTTTDPPKPYLGGGNVEVLKINTLDGLLTVNQLMANDCYAEPGGGRTWSRPYMNLAMRPYKFSSRNKFVSIGCDTLGYLMDGLPKQVSPTATARFSTGCASICNNITDVENGTCSGVGCCETPIPKGMQSFHILLQSYNNHNFSWNFSPCSFAFLADVDDSYAFDISSFTKFINRTTYPVTLEWSIGNKTCMEADDDGEQSACLADNSYCYNATNVIGYRCNCSEGYTGNPYLSNGCQDIDECTTGEPCIAGSQCQNVPGSYTCICPENKEGDARKGGNGCNCKSGMHESGSGCKASPKFPFFIVVLGASSALMLIVANIFWSYWALKKRKLIKLKEKFFQQNGGLLLEQRISQVDGATSPMKIFSSEELKKATKDFAIDRILGKGGFGTVYNGILSDGTVVAVKKSKIINQEQNEQFINEVVILSHINHRNVVKLIGCCLETDVPLLIYEFIPNDTLFHHIHDTGCKGSLSLDNRLRIAVETAEALAYLHSSTSTPIIHRDVKSSNILLDNNYVAKVSDFGMSRLVPFDQNYLHSLVRGTVGYLDPEYLQFGQFTDKSDVYSFGVVIVELLTGEKAVSANRMPGNGSLVSYFISHYNENRLHEILEDRVLDEGQMEKLWAIARVAKRCLCVKGEERPSMKEVSKELGELMFTKHPWTKKNDEEIEPFLMKPLLYDTMLSDASGTFSKDGSFNHNKRARGTFSEGESSNHVMLPFNLMR